MRDQRGITIIEVLVTTLVTSFVLLGMGSLYVATTRAFAESTSQASLQRQGTLALQELGQRIRSGVGSTAITSVTCNGQVNAVQVTTLQDGTFCYYAGVTGTADAGKLCEYSGAGCRDLLYGALQSRASTPITLLIQPAAPTPASPSCPSGVAASSACLVGTVIDATRAQFKFTITDGLTVMPFDITLTCSGRNC
jgi:Tfp pilus assembly protein PilW